MLILMTALAIMVGDHYLKQTAMLPEGATLWGIPCWSFSRMLGAAARALDSEEPMPEASIVQGQQVEMAKVSASEERDSSRNGPARQEPDPHDGPDGCNEEGNISQASWDLIEISTREIRMTYCMKYFARPERDGQFLTEAVWQVP